MTHILIVLCTILTTKSSRMRVQPIQLSITDTEPNLSIFSSLQGILFLPYHPCAVWRDAWLNNAPLKQVVCYLANLHTFDLCKTSATRILKGLKDAPVLYTRHLLVYYLDQRTPHIPYGKWLSVKFA